MEHSKVLSVFLLSLGLLSFALIPCFHPQITKTAYGTVDSSYATPEIGDTDIAGSSEITSPPLADLAPISATFNEPMDGTTLNSTTFIVRDSNGNNISGAVSLDSDNKTATFNPLSPLVYSTEYIATINSGATDLAGNPLTADKAWSFFTPDVIDNQSENISDASYYDTVDTNITSSEDVLTNGTSKEEVAPFYTYPAPNQQALQQQVDDNVSSSSTSSLTPVSEPIETTAIAKSLQPSTSETTTSFAGNLNQSSSTFTPLSNTKDNSNATPGQKGTEAGLTTSQPSQPLQQYQNNLLPYPQYYQYPPDQLYQNQQFSYPPSNLTNNNYITDGMGGIASPLAPGVTTTLQQPPLQQQQPPLQQLPPTPPSSFTEPLSLPDISPPETYLISAVDNNGVNVPSGAIVSSDLITITFEGVDDSGPIVEYQCSYDGQAPYFCASPFTIDNSMALTATSSAMSPNSNSHTLLISAIDASDNIDQTPAYFTWTIHPVGATETAPLTDTLLPTPLTESTILLPEVIQPPLQVPSDGQTSQDPQYGDNNGIMTGLGESNSVLLPPTITANPPIQ